MFKNKVSVDDHIVKNHPNFISSVARKIYECTECTYKTVQKSILDAHMSKHSSSGYERFNCMHCKATFKFKISCDDHVVQKHPEFIKSLTRKLHGCSECSYKTAIKSNLSKHVSQHVVHPSSRKWKCSQCDAIFKSKGALHNHVETHSETASSDEISKCEHCDATFKCEISLDDHIARKHTSSSNKLHECTAVKSKFNKHMTTHIGTASRYKCTYIDCNAVFKSQDSLDDHVVKKHPYSISSVSTKIYECTECNYKTTLKYKLGKHMLVHPESHSSYELGTCTHCSAVFKSEKALDEHVVREHPKFIKSLERKIYRCTECIYKTVFKYKFERHMSAHPETDSS
nr:unnamed protein product [Callosobruchus chinensis]